MGVFEESVAQAKQRLDAAGASLAPKLPVGRAFCSGDWWAPEVVKQAVVEAGWHIRKLRLDEVDLKHELLKSGDSFLVDGVLNDWHFRGAYEYQSAPDDDGPGPAADPAAWRHAVAVVGGFILEQKETINGKWLHLDGEGKPHTKKSYLREVLKAFRLWPCEGAAGCRGECARV
eukprot:1416068-Prymnesium_polylepis.1